jgi:2'-5' RNA ligase
LRKSPPARSFRESNPAHITLSASGWIDDEALRELARVAGVEDAEGELRTVVR